MQRSRVVMPSNVEEALKAHEELHNEKSFTLSSRG